MGTEPGNDKRHAGLCHDPGDSQAFGRQLKDLATSSGLTRATRVNDLGDGAPWIADQIEQQFGTQGRYLIDFYHLCDYLVAAAPVYAPGTPRPGLTPKRPACAVANWPQ